MALVHGLFVFWIAFVVAFCSILWHFVVAFCMTARTRTYIIYLGSLYNRQLPFGPFI